MGPGLNTSQGNTSVFEATSLLPNYEVSAKKVASAIADGQTASNAVLTGVPNAPSTMKDQDLKAQSIFLIRAVIAQVKHVLSTPTGEALSRTVDEVTKQTAELFRDTPKLRAQSQDATATVQKKTDDVAKALQKALGKETASSVQDLVEGFLTKLQHRITPADPLQLKQAELGLAQKQLAQAVVGAAADESNKRLLDAIVAYGRTKFETSLPTTPRQIANALNWERTGEFEPPVAAGDRMEVHNRVVGERTEEALSDITDAVRRFASHRERFPSQPLTRTAVENILVGESKLIGRQPTADLVVQDAQVSGTHLLLERIGQKQWALFDNGSTNGTYVNGNRLESKTRVEVDSGTAVSIGDTRFVLP